MTRRVSILTGIIATGVLAWTAIGFSLLRGNISVLTGQALPSDMGCSEAFAVPTSAAGAYYIAAGTNGNLWFTEKDANKIGRITPTGTITEFPLATSPNYPLGIAKGPDGNMWFTQDGNKIGKITPTGTVTEYDVPTPVAKPQHIVAGPDGNMWFTEFLGGKIGRITMAGVITEYAVPTSGGRPHFMTVGPDGNIWFTNYVSNKIGKITMSGVITEYTIPTPNSSPSGIVTGPDGNVWFTELSGQKIGKITMAGVITEYPLPSTGAYPGGIAAGSDGALWFTMSTDKIGRITTAGVITEHDAPAAGGDYEIVKGPDGNLWYTNGATNEIGKIGCGTFTTTGGSASLGPVPADTFTATGPNGEKPNANGIIRLKKGDDITIQWNFPGKKCIAGEGNNDWYYGEGLDPTTSGNITQGESGKVVLHNRQRIESFTLECHLQFSAIWQIPLISKTIILVFDSLDFAPPAPNTFEIIGSNGSRMNGAGELTVPIGTDVIVQWNYPNRVCVPQQPPSPNELYSMAEWKPEWEMVGNINQESVGVRVLRARTQNESYRIKCDKDSTFMTLNLPTPVDETRKLLIGNLMTVGGANSSSIAGTIVSSAASCVAPSDAFRTARATQALSCTIDATGNCHYPTAQTVSCPAGYKPISGTCSIETPGTTKTWDRPEGNGWVCKYAEFRLTGMVGQQRTVNSTAEVTCIKDDPSFATVQVVAEQKTFNVTVDTTGNAFSPRHTVTCPSGTVIVGGSCSIGGWGTTKVAESIQNNGYVCQYAETQQTPNSTVPIDSNATAFCLTDVSGRINVTNVTNPQIQSITVGQDGSALSPAVSVSCPQGTTVIGGSCSTGGWHTTKPVDRSEGNGWTCKIAEHNYLAYAGVTWQLSNTASATCVTVEACGQLAISSQSTQENVSIQGPSVCDTICGDGIMTGDELCDDGNRINTDACNNNCQNNSSSSSSVIICVPGTICPNGAVCPQDGICPLPSSSSSSSALACIPGTICPTGDICPLNGFCPPFSSSSSSRSSVGACVPGTQCPDGAICPQNGQCPVSSSSSSSVGRCIPGTLCPTGDACPVNGVCPVQCVPGTICPTGDTCPQNGVCPQESSSLSSAGVESCTINADCPSNLCLGGYCSCTGSEQCEGNACVGGFCTNIHAAADLVAFATCTSDKECPVNMLCQDGYCAPDLALCGNGIVDAGEVCDDGNDVDIDGCTATCLLSDGAACSNPRQCRSLICKDGVCTPCVSDNECPDDMACVEGACSTVNPIDSIDPDKDGMVVLSDGYKIAASLFSQLGSDARPENLSYEDYLLLMQQHAAGHAPVGSTGPESVAIMAAGASAGYAWMKMRKMKKGK